MRKFVKKKKIFTDKVVRGKMAEEINPFKKAQYTAVVSDLHLCEAEPVHPKYPLWKKYKTRQFFFDKEFTQWLRHIDAKAGSESVELVLNGDVFDFDSVTQLPEDPPYRISWMEKKYGLRPEEQRSNFKIKKILEDHKEWCEGLREFLDKKNNKVIFIVGNHDLELHFKKVQKSILKAICSTDEACHRVRFVDWFYISNQDTLIEHGNQYDPYCVAPDPLKPFSLKYNRIEVRIPFGNLASRYLINGMGFFNPHVDTNYLMSAWEYVIFFFKFIVKAQPFLLLTWLWGASLTLLQSFSDRLRPSLKDPLTFEDHIHEVAYKSNATPRMVRELRELSVNPAANNPVLIARELWLDRAFLIVIAFFGIFELFLFIKTVYSISFFWMFIPLMAFLPFFLFYSKSIYSEILEYKEPREKILTTTGMIAKVNRVIYGHTHKVRHEMHGPIEHLNSGTWSPAFEDIECKRPIDEKSYIWIAPSPEANQRQAQVIEIKGGQDHGSVKAPPNQNQIA